MVSIQKKNRNQIPKVNIYKILIKMNIQIKSNVYKMIYSNICMNEQLNNL